MLSPVRRLKCGEFEPHRLLQHFTDATQLQQGQPMASLHLNETARSNLTKSGH